MIVVACLISRRANGSLILMLPPSPLCIRPKGGGGLLSLPLFLLVLVYSLPFYVPLEFIAVFCRLSSGDLYSYG